MSTETATPTQAPDPLLAAIRGAAGDRLRPNADVQLATLWRADFEGVNPGIVGDLVRQRLADAQTYGHFYKAPTDPHVAAVEQMRARIATERAGAPGLNGKYNG